MKEQLVGFEVAKLAKEKGFGEPCWNYYGTYPDGGKKLNKSGVKMDTNGTSWGCSAPTQAFLFKWLREEHHIHIEIKFDWITYDVIIDKAEDNNRTPIKLTSLLGDGVKYTFTKYEEAFEEGLKQALKLISK